MTEGGGNVAIVGREFKNPTSSLGVFSFLSEEMMGEKVAEHLMCVPPLAHVTTPG